MEFVYFPKRDILSSPADLICIPVNQVGVMGAGLALQFAKKYPTLVPKYKAACIQKVLNPSFIVTDVIPELTIHDRTQYVAYVPTKRNWRDQSDLFQVGRAIHTLALTVSGEEQIQSVAIPPLGCGLGGLVWMDVHRILVDKFKDSDVQVMIYGASRP